ncbi:hypothetical protein DTO027B9_4721 [Paecilomyces variotii]|nr:hypothetical protein DTO027B9_4721 [Paecilomyces variotii]
MARPCEPIASSTIETYFQPSDIDGIETVHVLQGSDETPGSRDMIRSEHWRRTRKIGRGGFASVWLEECTFSQGFGGSGEGKLRAIKQIEFSSQFRSTDYERELEIIAKFSHLKCESHFVKSFGWHETSKHLFIAMEFCELGDLSRYFSRNPRLQEDHAKEVARQILHGLDIMHENGIAHRDLKPENVLIKSCPPKTWWIKLGDFGISKRAEELAQLHTYIGTREYMSPEIQFCKPTNIFANDIWALGEIVHYALTKSHVFSSPESLKSYRTQKDFPTSKLAEARISEEGIQFILRTMHPDPSIRETASSAKLNAWINTQVSLADTSRENIPEHPESASSPLMSLGQDSTGEYALTASPYTSIESAFTSDISGARDCEDSFIFTDGSIHAASEIGNLRAVRGFLNAGHDVNSLTSDRKTPLMEASKSGHLEVFHALLEAGADCQAADKQRWTSLHLAASNGHEQIVELLLAVGAAADPINLDIRTPLWFASQKGHAAIVKFLINTGKADLDIRDKLGDSALWWAARNGHADVVKLLLSSEMVDVNASSETCNNQTPLWWAAREGHEPVVALLLAKKGVEVDARLGGGWNESPFFWAVRNGHERIVQRLIETRKIEIDIRNKEKRSPLLWACRNGHESIVKLLLSTGKVDPNVYDQWHETPLFWAARNAHDGIVRSLLATNKVDVDSKNACGNYETPLWWAAKQGNDSTLEILLATGLADVNTQRGNGKFETPLYWAARNGHESVVKRLLATRKVNHRIKTGEGFTPLMAAEQNGHHAIVKLIANY